jgi:hypothetical protein
MVLRQDLVSAHGAHKPSRESMSSFKGSVFSAGDRGRTDVNDAGAGKNSPKSRQCAIGLRFQDPARCVRRSMTGPELRNEGDSRHSRANGERSCAPIRPGIAGHLALNCSLGQSVPVILRLPLRSLLADAGQASQCRGMVTSAHAQTDPAAASTAPVSPIC